MDTTGTITHTVLKITNKTSLTNNVGTNCHSKTKYLQFFIH